jgi:hypothetical protein
MKRRLGDVPDDAGDFEGCHEKADAFERASGASSKTVNGRRASIRFGFGIEDRAGRGREATMGEAMRGARPSGDHVRIESTLDWHFNFADADLGLRNNHGATVAFLMNPAERSVASSDAAEEAMFRAVEAIRRFRAVSAVVNRLSKRD